MIVLSRKIIDIAKIWIPLALTSTLLCGLLFIVVQHYIRQSANDPQIQLAQDRASLLSQNRPLQEVVPVTTVEIDKSISPFFIIFNEQKEVIASSALLDGKTPVPPQGVFEYVKTHGENRFTWAPREDVRIAAVITSFQGEKSGFILVGKSLQEVEKRVYYLTMEVFAGWIASLIVPLFAVTLLSLLKPRG